MSMLASELTRAMTTSTADLSVFDRETESWRQHPWPEVHAAAQNFAARLLDEDRGGAVGLVGDPTFELVAAIVGTWLAGAAVSILPSKVRGADPRSWAQATLERFDGVGARSVFSLGEHLELLKDGGSPLPVSNVAAAVRHRQSSTVPPSDGEVALLQGTAGSTGTPRTAVLSPDAVLSNIRGLTARVEIDLAHDVGCSWLPLYHDMGLAFTLSAALSGSPMWLVPTTAFAAAPFRWLTWLSETRATMTAGPNFAYNLIGRYAQRVRDVDLGRLRLALNGGEPVDCDGFGRFATELACFGFDPGASMTAYGLAESVCAVTMPVLGSGLRTDEATGPAGPRRRAVVGTPIPGMELRLRPVDSHDIVDRDVGEIEIRGTSLMSGYLGGPAIGRQSWFPTGDLGYLVDGDLVVCGRAKEVISIAGRNIFPNEVEDAAAQVKGVREGAVVAVATGAGSARPGLALTAEYRGPDAEGARREVMRQVASACGVVPAQVVLVSPGSLPRTSSGKLRRLEVQRNWDSIAT